MHRAQRFTRASCDGAIVRIHDHADPWLCQTPRRPRHGHRPSALARLRIGRAPCAATQRAQSTPASRPRMSRLVIVVEKASDWGSYYPSDNVVTAQDYLKEAIGNDDERTQVINLCRSYKYLGTGYYVS